MIKELTLKEKFEPLLVIVKDKFPKLRFLFVEEYWIDGLYLRIEGAGLYKLCDSSGCLRFDFRDQKNWEELIIEEVKQWLKKRRVV